MCVPGAKVFQIFYFCSQRWSCNKFLKNKLSRILLPMSYAILAVSREKLG